MHKGLDAVFGESRKNAVLDGLYGQMHEQIEAVNTGYGFDLDTTEGRRAATEEYLAECAEFCGHDWRKFDRENEEDVTRWLAEHNMALMRRKEGVRGVLEERGELSVRPAWWREFLQKVKMFFYGFKGFSNYRFTDREIETLLLRGYRKTRAGGGSKFKVEGSRLDTVRTTADRPQERVRFSIDEEGKPLFNVQGYGEQKLESILQDKSISAKTQILTDDGSPDWGRVSPEMIANAPADLNLKALPIRLFKGDYGYGLVHLSKHLKDFTGRDLSNVILNVFGKPNKIYARRDGDAIKLEVFPKPPSQWGILELREEQGCYSVVTFYPRDNAHSKPKGEMIWRFGSQTETSQAASDQSRNGATGETPQVTQEETTVQTSHNINPFDIKVKYALEDGSDFSDGMDKYTLENAKASKEGYRVERVNENAGRELTEAQGVVCEVNQVFNPEEAPEKGFKGWVLKKSENMKQFIL